MFIKIYTNIYIYLDLYIFYGYCYFQIYIYILDSIEEKSKREDLVPESKGSWV